MEEKMKQVLYKWLEIDLVNIAKKMGLSNKSCDVNLELLMDTIRCLDYESIVVKKPSVNYIITVIGLMWEHVDHTKFDLRKFVIKILSRIGYPTSAIICDKDFDKENGTFSGIDSWIDEVALTINQMKNEIMVADQKYLLTDYQKQIWDSMDNDKVLGISAPTSAGKSFVILLKLVDKLINDNIDIVYRTSVATVYKGNIIKNLIMDCQSYTKYRPNETTGGIFVSWRRKEELPTGA